MASTSAPLIWVHPSQGRKTSLYSSQMVKWEFHQGIYFVLVVCFIVKIRGNTAGEVIELGKITYVLCLWYCFLVFWYFLFVFCFIFRPKVNKFSIKGQIVFFSFAEYGLSFRPTFGKFRFNSSNRSSILPLISWSFTKSLRIHCP